MEVVQVRREAVEEWDLREDPLGQQREPLRAEDRDAEGGNGEERQQYAGSDAEGQGAQKPPGDHAGAIGGPFGDDYRRGACDRGARGLADEDALEDLAKLARR